jgi:hypothetical protein
MNLFQTLFQYILQTTKYRNIDESHGVSHAMNVLVNAHESFQIEVKTHTHLQSQEKVIYIAAALHDMCDKKYMDEDEGIQQLDTVLYDDSGTNTITPRYHLEEDDIEAIKTIIRTMSYSKVKVNGFPDLGKYQQAYHIVREADLLAAYDFDRAMIYHMYQNDKTVVDAYEDSVTLFHERVLRHKEDGLLTLDYSIQQHYVLMPQSHARISHWKTLLKKGF